MVMQTENNPYLAANSKAALSDLLNNTLDSNQPTDTSSPYGIGASSSDSYSFLDRGAPAPAATPAAGMGPRFQALADRAGVGAVAAAAAPAAHAVGSMIPQGVSDMAGAMAQKASEAPSFGRMQSYLNQYRNKGVRDFTHAPPPENIDDFAARLAMRESSGRGNVTNPYTPAAGLFQYMPDTWGGHGGFKTASEAPEEIQYQKFITDLAGSLKRNKGDLPTAILEHFGGPGDAQSTLKNPAKFLFQAPGTHNGDETRYKRIASLLSEDAASKWAAQHQGKLADATAALQNVYNVASRE